MQGGYDPVDSSEGAGAAVAVPGGLAPPSTGMALPAAAAAVGRA
jgi:hypothetical protein